MGTTFQDLNNSLNTTKKNQRFLLTQSRFARGFFILFFVSCMIQNGTSLFLFQLDPSIPSFYLVFKDILILIGIFLLLIINYPKTNNHFFLIALSAALFIIPSVMSPMFNIRSLRTVLNMHIFFMFGILLRNHASPENFKRVTIVIISIIGISGLIEYFLLRDAKESFFSLLNYSQYYSQREGGASINLGIDVVPASWYTYDYYEYFGRVARSASLFILDPLLYAHAIAVGVIYAFITRRVILLSFLACCIFTTVSKGGYLVVALSLTMWAQGRIRIPALRYAALTVLVLLIGIAFSSLLDASSSARHAEGFTGSFKNLVDHPLGTGVGTGGNLAIRELRETLGNSNVDYSEYGAESYFGSLVAQAGIIGLISYVLFGYLIWHFRPEPWEKWSIAVRYTALATWIAGFGSESAISMVGTSYLFILSALVGSGRDRFISNAQSPIRMGLKDSSA